LEDAGPVNVPYLSKVRWLSRAKMLDVIFQRRREILSFYNSCPALSQEGPCVLSDEEFIRNLAFASDVVNILASFNVAMQGKNKTVFALETAINRNFIVLTMLQNLEEVDSALLPNTFSILEDLPQGYLNRWRQPIENLINDLRSQFAPFLDMMSNDLLIKFFKNPFDADLPQEPRAWGLFYAEVREIQTSTVARTIFCETATRLGPAFDPLDFFKAHGMALNAPRLFRRAQEISTFFGTTWVCESLFSSMAAVKDKTRSRMKDDLLEAYLTLQNRI
jgi:hypothetical protein